MVQILLFIFQTVLEPPFLFCSAWPLGFFFSDVWILNDVGSCWHLRAWRCLPRGVCAAGAPRQHHCTQQPGSSQQLPFPTSRGDVTVRQKKPGDAFVSLLSKRGPNRHWLPFVHSCTRVRVSLAEAISPAVALALAPYPFYPLFIFNPCTSTVRRKLLEES